jgi:hypothetical protein
VGDVHAIDQEGQIVERIEGHALSPEMALMAYLDHEVVRSPLEYVCLSALVQRQYLPLFYFVHLAGVDLDEAIAALEATVPVYRLSKRRALLRLRNQWNAYARPGGAIVEVVNALQGDQVANLRSQFTDIQLVRGFQGLPDGAVPTIEQRNLLKGIYCANPGNVNVRSGAFRGAARLDELEHMQRNV